MRLKSGPVSEAARKTEQSARAPTPAPELRQALAAPRIVIDRLTPCVDGGRFPVKAVVGQPVVVEADIFMDGHEVLAADLLWRAGDGGWQRLPMRLLGNDRWRAAVVPVSAGVHRYTVEAWHDEWGSFRSELGKKHAAGMPTQLEVREGIELVKRAAARAPQDNAVRTLADRLAASDLDAARSLLLADDAAATMRGVDERRFLARHAPDIAVDVERKAAVFASWYELFPRSQARDGRHGTFDDVIARLPAIAAMGFDTLYMPPIHPIGRKNRKGRNNSLRAAPEDPGSPYAIGAEEGGHDAVHPELGGIDAFRRLRHAAADYGLEIALDFAIQCSPDHPWLSEHPEWFRWRHDGSLRYAENPPKKYEDIVNVEFYAENARPALWTALRDVVEYWACEGVRCFRVDNPHTKPLPFWQWLIADIRSRHPEVLFLSEAFTRPAMMYRLAKIGFSQSYTYFTWRNDKRELTEYMTELTSQAPRDFFRPHFFVNTPDINPFFLQSSTRAAFLIRAALASTLSGLWGMYSGFELCEGAALPGREEYLDSEKYEIRPRDWTASGNISAEIARLNHIRRENPALHTHLNLRFYTAHNDQVIYYGKRSAQGDNVILVAVSLDPQQPQEAWFEAPLWEFGMPDHGVLDVEELMTGARFAWHGKHQHWRFVPQELPFAIWRIHARGS